MTKIEKVVITPSFTNEDAEMARAINEIIDALNTKTKADKK